MDTSKSRILLNKMLEFWSKSRIGMLDRKFDIWWYKQTHFTRYATALALGAAIIVVLISLAKLTETDTEVVCRELSRTEVTDITARLAVHQIPYTVSPDSSEVSVPVGDAGKAMFVLASGQRPMGGFLNIPEYQQLCAAIDPTEKDGWRDKLEKRFEKLFLGNIDAIESIRVHLEIPDITRPNDGPLSADIHAIVAPGQSLPEETIEAIGKLLSASIRGLVRDSISITNERGQALFPRSERDDVSSASDNVEAQLERKAQRILDETIGKGAAVAVVHVRNHAANLLGPLSSSIIPTNEGFQGKIRLILNTKRMVYDRESDGYELVDIDEEQIRIATETVNTALGLDGARGDQIEVVLIPYTSRQYEMQERHVKARNKRFWTDIAITVAKLLGIVAALVTLSFIIKAVGQPVATGGLGEGKDQQLEELDLYLTREKALSDYTKELDVAREMQMGLMHRRSPDIRGAEVVGRCVPCLQVGGDLFQYSQMGEDRWLISLADVTGHGMEAAIPLMFFHGLYATVAGQKERLETTLSTIDNTTHGIFKRHPLTKRTFVCLSGCELDVREQKVRVFNRGCPYPFVYWMAERRVEEVSIDAYPIGVAPGGGFAVSEFKLNPGDRVVLVSDGLIEAQNKKGELFGFDRMAYTILRECRVGVTASGLLEKIYEEVGLFAEGSKQEDDRTVVVIGV